MIRTDITSLRKGCRKAAFYISNFTRYVLPDKCYRIFFTCGPYRLSEEEKAVAKERTDYYIRLPKDARIDPKDAVRIGDFKYPFGQQHKFSAYFFDLYEYIRNFHKEFRFHYLFGDVDYETPKPAFVKSRPITDGTTLSVVCKLNKVRHFRFINDSKGFRDKKDQLVFRNEVRRQPQRTRLLELYLHHPMCDLGQINDDSNREHPEFLKPYMTIGEQLNYKFIACIEGHDVATNLKWVMSSNSLAVMPRPNMESWFMEGRLVGDYHYVEVKEDYSDLIEKMEYYSSHPDEAEAIIAHAHEFVSQFRNKRLERYIQYCVIQRYFERTCQLNQPGR